MEENPIHNTYTPAAKERLRRYREKHKEKVNQINNDYYHKRMESDPEYKQKLREQAKARYYKKKAEKEAQKKLEEENKEEEKKNLENEVYKEENLEKKNKSIKKNKC